MNVRRLTALILLSGLVIALTACMAAQGAKSWPQPRPGRGSPTPGNVDFIGHIGGSVNAVAVQGDYAYAGGSELAVIDISDPFHPQRVGYVVPSGGAAGVAVAGSYAYVAAGRAGLRVVDVSDPTAPAEVGTYETPDGAWDVHVTGDYAYVAAGKAGLYILRFTGTNTPTSTQTATPTATSTPSPTLTPPPEIAATTHAVAQRTTQMELPQFNWGEGLAAYGLLETWRLTGDRGYFNAVKAWLDRTLDDVPEDQYWDLTAGAPLLVVYEETGDQKYLNKAVRLADRLIEEQPRSDQGHFVGEGYNSIIVDGLLATTPFLARLGAITGQRKYLDEAARQVDLYAQDLQAENGLFYHYAHLGTGDHAGEAFWQRGNGWAALSAAEVLSSLPPNHPRRKRLVEILEDLAGGLASYQADSGLWPTVVDRPDFYQETSGALAIGYGIRKAIRNGDLSAEHWPMTERIEAGARQKVAPDGTVLDVSAGTGFAESQEAYNQIPHDEIQPWGQGLYLLFAAQGSFRTYLPVVR